MIGKRYQLPSNPYEQPVSRPGPKLLSGSPVDRSSPIIGPQHTKCALPERVLYVGDTSMDMDTASAAGMVSVGVTWGFRDEAELRDHGARHIIHKPIELLELLQ